jgi:adenosylcobyric acid synthase
LRIAVIALPSFSNFTDFDALRAEPSVSIHFCRTPEQLSYADIVIIPGSKQTADDLAWMHSQGLGKRIADYAGEGLVVGICGGMQMLGKEIQDPHGMEHTATMPGLGLLAINTTMQPQKITRISSGCLAMQSLFGQPISSLHISGYEIHVGDTAYLEGAKPFAKLSAESGERIFLDGCVAHDNHTFGTYLHGLFDDDGFRHAFLSAARMFYGLSAAGHLNNWKQQREASLNRLTDAVRAAIDIPKLFSLVGLTCDSQSQKETQP